VYVLSCRVLHDASHGADSGGNQNRMSQVNDQESVSSRVKIQTQNPPGAYALIDALLMLY
jgi:hypothetical protein